MPGTPVNNRNDDERSLNFWEKIFLPKIFEGLGYSFNKIKNEPVYTVEYPEEQWYPPDSYRGRPVLVEEEGSPRCVSCNLCARACPPMAISMQSQEVDSAKEREPAWFEINMLRCIYCGFCEEVCPEEAIVMSKEYDLTFQDRDEAVFGLDKLLVPVERLMDRLDYLHTYKDPQFGQEWDFQHDNNLHSLKDRRFLSWLVEEGAEALETTHQRNEQPSAANRSWGSARSGGLDYASTEPAVSERS
ncbi:MAG: 4Fe-4S dicluster domain-containing protein [Bacteroidetes bacterium]|jgi:NADH-quinone oxidoreductase subunit I|nr:4Fe-4S dicluster domain-containing protein [Bacteroidota bacterium]